jgi:hypothetical protein
MGAGVMVLGVATGLLAGSSCARDEHRVEVRQGDCYTCHQPEYEATTSPPHPGLFSQTCSDCHGKDDWVPAAAIVHEWFVLRNRHADPAIRCADCHTVGFRPGDTPDTCDGCHHERYLGASAPPHAGMPTDCASCHTDAGWVPSTFVHGWTLDGAHAATPCASCHVGSPPVYAGTPTECIGCHRADYESSPYPRHATFRTTCLDCHTTAAWRPALGHPEGRFPISRGAHSDFACADCHDEALGSPSMGMNTDCIGCHTGEHSRARVDDQHREVRGYPVGDPNPHFCLDCHPDGRH